MFLFRITLHLNEYLKYKHIFFFVGAQLKIIGCAPVNAAVRQLQQLLSLASLRAQTGVGSAVVDQ